MKKDNKLVLISKVRLQMYLLLIVALGFSFFLISYFTEALATYDWAVIIVYLILFMYTIFMLKQIKVYNTKIIFKYLIRPTQKIINFSDIDSFTYQPVKVSGIKMNLLKIYLINNETITIASLIYSDVDLIIQELEKFFDNKGSFDESH